MGVVLAFLLEHLDLLELLASAINAGVSKETLTKKIKDEMTLASDAAIDVEFPGA